MQHSTFSPARLLSSATIVLALIASSAHASAGAKAGAKAGAPPPATVSVMGEASVTSNPDRVELDLGVVTRARTAQEAASENARVLQDVLTALRSALGPKADIETISYALQPDYQYPPQGGAPKITGYTATNVVRVTMDDVRRVGTVIDAATGAGANQVQRIRFTLADEGAAKSEALRLAARDARAKAASLATALGLRFVRIRAVAEASATPRPFYDLELARVAAPTTPILPGSIETTATVTLTIEVGTGR